MSASIWCYLWDLVDEGINRALDEIQSAGIDAVSVATAYHSVEHWRVRNVRPFVFRERDASLYFVPRGRWFSRLHLRPRVSPLVAKENPLQAVGAKCRERGMSLHSWTVGLHNSYLCRQHPDCAQGNIFGDSSGTSLCPSNPRVREYLVGMLEDLTTNHPIERVELESFTFEGFPHFHSHEKIGIQFGETDRFLLGLCFCRCCRGVARKAGVDVKAAERLVGRILRRTFESGESTRTPLEEFVDKANALRPYLAARERAICSFMAELRKAGRDRLAFMHYTDRWRGGYQMKDIASSFDSVMLLCYGSPAETGRAIARARAEIGERQRIITGFHAFAPVMPDAKTLKAQVATARRSGVRDFNLYNYGIMPRRNLKWVRDALSE